MVAHLTSRPAKRIGIYPHRGLLAQGSAADLVLFHPETIMDKATYDQPKLRAEGIRFVLVNGEVAMDEGQLTGMRAGRTLRRSGGDDIADVERHGQSGIDVARDGSRRHSLASRAWVD
jgi:N-acyl-D-amino-acid deacylase